MRWIQLAMFSPLMRNHTALGTRMQEVYQFDHMDRFRDILGLRYGMLPYIYSEYMRRPCAVRCIFTAVPLSTRKMNLHPRWRTSFLWETAL